MQSTNNENNKNKPVNCLLPLIFFFGKTKVMNLYWIFHVIILHKFLHNVLNYSTFLFFNHNFKDKKEKQNCKTKQWQDTLERGFTFA